MTQVYTRRIEQALVPVLAIIFVLASTVSATTFYVSVSGSNDNDGLSPATPWKDPQPFMDIPFPKRVLTGDTIAFNRGEVFRMTINQTYNQNPSLSFQDYGDPNLPKPVISGADVVPSGAWTPAGLPNVYKATLQNAAPFAPNTTVAAFGGQVLDGARSTFYHQSLFAGESVPGTLTPRTPVTSFVSNDLKAAIAAGRIEVQDIVGSYFTIRNKDWTFEVRKILSVDSTGKITWAGAMVFGHDAACGTGWGFFFWGSPKWFTKPGQFVVDQTGRTVYVWLPGNADPRTSTNQVEVSVRDVGIRAISRWSDSIYKNLRFELQYAAGITVKGNRATSTGNNQILNCEFFGQGRTGLDLDGTNKLITVNGNTFDNCNRGLFAANVVTLTVNNNTATNIGLLAEWGYRESKVDASGFFLQGSKHTVTNNVIRQTGYASIQIYGTDHVVSNNYVSKCTMRLNDCGCLYTALTSSNNIQFLNNVIEQSIGNLGDDSGMPFHGGRGIMVDLQASNMVIKGNTIWGTSSPAVFINGGPGSLIEANTIFDAWGPYQIEITEWAKGSTAGTVVKNNVLYIGQTAPPAYAVKDGTIRYAVLETSKTATAPREVATYSGNTYWSPYNALIFEVVMGVNQVDLGFSGWQNYLGNKPRDMTGSLGPYQSTGYSVTQDSTKWVVTNFDDGTPGVWSEFPNKINNADPQRYSTLSIQSADPSWPAGAKGACTNKCAFLTSALKCASISSRGMITTQPKNLLFKGAQKWRVQFTYSTTSPDANTNPMLLTVGLRHVVKAGSTFNTTNLESLPFGRGFPLDLTTKSFNSFFDTNEVNLPANLVGAQFDIRIPCGQKTLAIDSITIAQVNPSTIVKLPEEGVFFYNPTKTAVTKPFPVADTTAQYQDITNPTKFYCGSYTLKPFTSVILARPRKLGKSCAAFSN